MKAININCKHQDFIEKIFNREKTLETREKNTLKSLIGKRVGIIRTGCGKAMLVGEVDIVGVVIYHDEDEFRRDDDKHRVYKGSPYDIKKDGIKYGYVLKNPVRYEKETGVTAKGIVIRNI